MDLVPAHTKKRPAEDSSAPDNKKAKSENVPIEEHQAQNERFSQDKRKIDEEIMSLRCELDKVGFLNPEFKNIMSAIPPSKRNRAEELMKEVKTKLDEMPQMQEEPQHFKEFICRSCAAVSDASTIDVQNRFSHEQKRKIPAGAVWKVPYAKEGEVKANCKCDALFLPLTFLEHK